MIHSALTVNRWFSRCLTQSMGVLRRGLAVFVVFAVSLAPVAPALYAAPAPAKSPRPTGEPDGSADGCQLNSARGEIKHVIYIQFDNVHFTRDNPNVPSDLEQMPHLLDFMTDNGTVMTNHHTPLKSHTADDIITSLTGVYGDRHGQPIANSFGWFVPNSDGFASSFAYWTDIVNATTDPTFFMITPDGKNAPAPWVPWTRAGCNVGAVSIANMEFENVSGDIKTAFASNPTLLAAALAEAKSNFSQAVADYEGISIHCAAGNAVCSNANNGVTDALLGEPGGYSGFNALFGHKLVAPVISPGGPLTDLDGNPLTGFPGFGGISAAQTLSYVAAMQENGVPVTYAYISDVHDDHYGTNNAPGPAVCNPANANQPGGDPELAFGTAMGPGELCYEAQMAAYDEAFGKFFARLKADGITKHNTLFVITADEGDHFAGGAPVNGSCDGVTIPCSYISNGKTSIGELDANITGLLASEQNVTAPFDVQFDDAPVFYVFNPTQLTPGAPLARTFEQAAGKLTAPDVHENGATVNVTDAMVDPVGMKLLHMITGDPLRTPTFILWGNPDFFFETGSATACTTIAACVNQSAGFAWNHGDIQKEIVTTWLGLVGPGIRNKGVDDDVWSDHTDIRPTMLALTGLKDDYQSEGRVLAEELHGWALPDGVSGSGDEFVELARAYKAINAPNGELCRTSLKISTRALEGDTGTYNFLEGQLAGITEVRDLLAEQMLERLEDAEFHGKRISEWEEQKLTHEAYELLDYVKDLAHE